MTDRCNPLAVIAALATLVTACAVQVAAPPATTGAGPADFPDDYYRQLMAQGKPVFRVDPARSLVIIEARRSGSLARFGHDHVIASHDVTGCIAPDEGRADLHLPLNALVIDEPALRAEAGFDTQPSPADIAGTRRNMLEKVLETDRYASALIAVNDGVARRAEGQLQVVVTLHGTTRIVDATAQVENTADEISATGTMALDQSQFGIAPFSILGGAIAVEDRVTIRFRVHGNRGQTTIIPQPGQMADCRLPRNG